MMETARCVLALLAVAIGTTIIASLQWLVLKLRLPVEHALPRAWHKLVVRALGARVELRGAPSLSRPLLVVANHVSWTDIMVLGSLLDGYFVAKSELAGWPVFGSLAKLQRTIFVNRERRRLAGSQSAEIAQRLASGKPVFLFAEGTTGDGNRPLPFKSTLFSAAALASEAGGGPVFVQPVSIVYTRLHGIPLGRQDRIRVSWIGDMDLVPHLLFLLRRGALDVQVTFGEPIPFEAGSDRKKVAREAEERVRRMMGSALQTAGR